jgi:hypothetical protein
VFDIAGAFLDEKDDHDSPYVVDANGDVHKKTHAKMMKELKHSLDSNEWINAALEVGENLTK